MVRLIPAILIVVMHLLCITSSETNSIREIDVTKQNDLIIATDSKNPVYYLNFNLKGNIVGKARFIVRSLYFNDTISGSNISSKL